MERSSGIERGKNIIVRPNLDKNRGKKRRKKPPQKKMDEGKIASRSGKGGSYKIHAPIWSK